jgi:ATP-dependent exoDNAse (exonuclease V) beta subunit
VDATRLRSRLGALPAEDFEDLDHELDQLLQAAADAESIGATLEEFAELLRANFNTERESRSPRHGAIQLITCQKAKGLEWDAVIVPFFSRRVHTADENFPRIIVMPQSQRPMVAFCKADIPADAKDALKQVQRQEMERLLYVALTRARHSLVLVADHQFFAKSDGAAPEASLTTWFRSGSGQINETRVTALATAAESCVSTDGFQVRSARREAEVQQFAFFPEGALRTGRLAANRFSRRYIPSSFAAGVVSRSATATDSHEETEREFRAVTLPSSATRYGVWWHEFIQQVPWWAEAEGWDRVFNEMPRLSPDHGRSAR